MTTAESLKKQYKTFNAAKAAEGFKAKSWAVLAEKINAAGLQARIAELEAENAALKQQLATAQGFDLIGFWLLDANFDRSNLEDFGFTKDVLETKLAVEAAFVKLSLPTATPEQQANLNKFRNQLMGMAAYSESVEEHAAKLTAKRAKLAADRKAQAEDTANHIVKLDSTPIKRTAKSK
jgi:hypothetical protein